MAKIELKTEELTELLKKMQGDALGRPEPQSTVMGQEGPRRGAEENLGMFQTLRAAKPVESPAAPGTITQARRHSEEQARLQREQMALQERLARMSAAAARSSAGAQQTQAPGIQNVAGAIQMAANAAAREGRPFSDVIQALNDPETLKFFHSHGVKMDDAVNLARSYYEPHLSDDALANPTSRSFGQALLSDPKYSPMHEGFDYAPPPQEYVQRALQDLAQHTAPAQSQDKQIQPGLYERPNGTRYQLLATGRKIELGSGDQMTQ